MEGNNIEFNRIDTGNPLRDLFFNYYIKLDHLRSSNNIDELRETVNKIITLLPNHVTSFTVPISRGGEITQVKSERESTLPEEQSKEWGLTDLLDFSISIDSPDINKPSD